MGEDIRRNADQVLASLRVVRQPIQTGLFGLPSYWCWYSQLKNAFVLSPAEYEDCKRVFQERGMQTFGDWLEYYNNLGVSPFLEALVKMRDFYTDLGIDIFKDAVSLPGVSMQYISRGTLSGRNASELYVPGLEAYAMLKGAVVGGPSLVFTRKQVAGQTRIRPHKYEEASVTRRILGFDANSLYPSTMLYDMPCGPGRVVHYENAVEAAQELPFKLVTGQWFGFADVDIEVPRELWEKFEEFPSFFINRAVPDEGVPQHMQDYLRDSGRTRFPDQKKLLGVLSAKKMLIYALLLQWYLNRGLKITAVYRTINYMRKKIFNWFVQEVANNRRAGNADKEKALLAEVFKLLGNSAYGKFIEAWSARCGRCTPRTRTRWTSNSARLGSKTWKQSGTSTRSSAASQRSRSTALSRRESWCTSWPSSACWSSTTTSWTTSSTGATSSSSG